MSTNSVDQTNPWNLAVGRGFVAFGQIEYATHIALKSFCRDPIFNSLKTLNLEKKLEIIDSLLGQYEQEEIRSLRTLFKQVNALSKTRNLVAHNPLVLDIYEKPDGDYMVDSKIRSLRNEKHYSLNEIQEFAQKAEDLGGELVQEAVLCGALVVLKREP